MRQKLGRDARILVGFCIAAVLVILVGAFFAPARIDDNPVPTTWNSGSAGAKGAYLLLEQLGYRTQRLEESEAALDNVDAPHATLILAGAQPRDYRKDAAFVAGFLNRGGHVLATSAISAQLLPDPHVAAPSHLYTDLCYTTPQGLGPLARAGRVTMKVPVRWDLAKSAARSDQACGDDAVVVHYLVGKGEAIWWSTSLPLSNRGLKEDPSLKLLLASIGPPGSIVIFDENIHGAQQSLWDTANGTPVFAMGWQLLAVAILLILSFSRRSGPLRALAATPRTSPLEFAESMGDLYRKAGAVSVATDCAERRLMHFLETQGGIPRTTLNATPEILATAVSDRFRYRPVGFAIDIQAARDAESNKLSPGSALGLVKRLDHHIASLTALMKHSQSQPEPEHGETRD
jgi:hypothetical protein